MTSLELAGVCRSFGGLQAVHDVSLTICKGAITGLIGPNGAGKSTVVNLTTGLLRLTSGSVTCDGREIGSLPPHDVARLGIARTFQNINLMGDASVLDNVLAGFQRLDQTSLADRLLGLPSVFRQKAAFTMQAYALLATFEMDYLAHTAAGQLPYGHQRRLEIMRALAMSPNFLLLDEPVAGMNDVEAADLGRQIRRVAEDGVGVLLIEHNVGFVMELCSRIYVLSSGRLIAQGTAGEVRIHPGVIEAYLVS